MSSSFVTSPRFQAFDSAGLPLSGGLLYTYSPATTTNKATYPTVADALAGTNANANPVVLDSRGEATVVLKGTTKLVLKDSLGNTIWTQDNVEPNTVQFDANGNELIKYVATASAVNEITFTNAATGGSPTIAPTGDDTNIDLTINAKGSGTVVISSLAGSATTLVPGTNSAAGRIRVYEQTTNGTSYIELAAPASLSANRAFILPSADGSANTFLQTNGSGTLAFADISAWAATQADQEASTSTTTFVSPGRQQYHPSAAKAWGVANVSGTINASHNLTSVTDNGTGDITWTWNVDFSSASYVANASINTGTSLALKVNGSMLAGSCNVISYNLSNVATDPTQHMVAAFGDQ